jgi:hypothetical protein
MEAILGSFNVQHSTLDIEHFRVPNASVRIVVLLDVS